MNSKVFMLSDKDQANYSKLYDQLLILLGDESASKFCADLWACAQIFDDIYDEGEVPHGQVMTLINLTMVRLPSNSFYDAHRALLQPLVHSLIIQWDTANQLELKGVELHKAFMLRAFVFQIFQFCACLLHGFGYSSVRAEQFQALYGESFEQYSKEFK